jgi:succinate dehydrogenase/fumarate reductase flavoprotein subunit
MGSWSIASATVLGYRAGENAARFAQGHQSLEIDEAEVNLAKTKLYAPLGEVEMDPEALLQRIQKILFNTSVLILKNEKVLKAAIDQIFSIREEMIPQMRARDVHELVELKQVDNMVLIAELMLKASLMRTESRGSHYREDYPRLDNENWMKWIVVSQENGDINLRTEPLPLDKYRFKPTRYYSDNFRIPGE